MAALEHGVDRNVYAYMIVPLLMSVLVESTIEIDVAGAKRTAVVVAPAEPKNAPLVLVFHGHGGTAQAAQRAFNMEKHWPEAFVIYPQGLPTATQRDPEGKKNGWNARSTNDNRDLEFFDALLDWAVKKHQIDASRVYITGHSNGGGFVYLLGSQRGDKLRAAAPSSAGPSTRAKEFAQIPVLHLAGEKDPIVPFASQERCVGALKERLGVAEVEGKKDGLVTVFKKAGAPEVRFFVHPGGHGLPVAAYQLIAEFFKAQN